MAALILEIQGRHGPVYHKIDQAITRVGRAFDNDIILSDPTVSAHHFVVRRDADGGFVLHPGSDENGLRHDRRKISEPLVLQSREFVFEAGRTRMRLLPVDAPIAPTRLMHCPGGACLFGHWGWALLLFGVLVAFSAVDNFLSTPLQLSWESYWKDQVIIVLIIAGFAFGLLVVNRLTSHRWDFAASLSFVSLALGLNMIIDRGLPFIDYYFNSAIPSFAFGIVWGLLIMPVALLWFLLKLQHGNTVGSLVTVAMLLSPAAYFQVDKLGDHYDLWDEFSGTAYYESTLVPWDYRREPTL
ncbi:MAG: FHA domain-containing protein, partial [Gammaproteobacteria bacterium]|nr:FHA domain-containing protein [Gammaproteobacteria bacterium]